jgi:glycosyltransferase involved in cell wall biosynthesis
MQFHLLSFEGPDPYARAGGIASRISGLADALVQLGFAAHLWFVGDPDLPGHESRGNLALHRWCQWISHYHRGGVYDGEEGKRLDYVSSLPPYLLEQLLPVLHRGERVTVLAEEWHTVDAVLHLDWLLRQVGLRPRVTILWNANNTFGFERIDWGLLREAALITTVSRYMRQLMRRFGVDPLVIPNGLSPEAFATPTDDAVTEIRRRLAGRPMLAKVARFDPDKSWLTAIGITAELKRHGSCPLLIARGGVEPHGGEVMRAAADMGLRVVERTVPQAGAAGLLDALRGAEGADVIRLRSPLDGGSCRLLYRAASAVLANSRHEPFGLVGLETMAVGGVACTGASGEDYAIPGRNAIVLYGEDPVEFVRLFRRLSESPEAERSLRESGRATAHLYAWPGVIERVLLPRLDA